MVARSTGVLLVFALLAPFVAAAQDSTASAARLISHPTSDAAFPSPDGRKLVYIMTVGGKEQLFTMNVDGTGIEQLTHDRANHEDPAWSPDGLHIAYVSDADSNEVIFVMNRDGSHAVSVTPRGVRAIHPAWSHDSRRLLYCTDDDLHPPKKNASDIYSVDLATRRTTLLITGGVNTYPSLSPDGLRIAFRRMVGEANSEVFVANADGGDARNLTNSDAFDGWPEWSPDGTRLAFASNRGDGRSYRIYVMDLDGGRVQLVANTVGRATAPHWSPDGSRIYFTNCVRFEGDFQCNIFSGRVDSR